MERQEKASGRTGFSSQQPPRMQNVSQVENMKVSEIGMATEMAMGHLSCSPFPLKWIRTKFCRWQLLASPGPQCSSKGLSHTCDMGLRTQGFHCPGGLHEDHSSLIGHFAYIICKLEGSPHPQ